MFCNINEKSHWVFFFFLNQTCGTNFFLFQLHGVAQKQATGESIMQL